MSPLTLVTLLSLATHVLGTSTNSCRFPQYLQHEGNPNNRWMYRIHNQGARGASTHLYLVTFNNEVMGVEADVRGVGPPEGFRLYRRQCLLSKPGGFIVSQEYDDSAAGENEVQVNLQFLCVRFTRISKYVVILSAGQLTENWSTGLCGEEMVDDTWPLVSLAIEESVEPVALPEGLIGGYQFSLRNPVTGDVMCPVDLFRPARLEVGCLPDSDMIFRMSGCSKWDLKMDDIQYVENLGVWSDLDFTYLVLKRINSMNMWCFRIPNGDVGGEFSARLYLDVECTSSDTQYNYLQMEFWRREFDGLCQDISETCEAVNRTDHDVCRGTLDRNACLEYCGSCTSLMLDVGPQNYCVFGDAIQGAWIQASEVSKGEVLIRPSKIYLLQEEPLQCLPTSRNLSNRYPLVFLGRNGCFPKFTCIEFTTLSSGYLKYRVATTRYWPEDILSLSDPYDVFCSDAQFDGRYNHLLNRYVEPEFHSLVFDPRRPASDRRGANCDIVNAEGVVLQFLKLPGSAGQTCQGVFTVPCDNPTVLQISSSDCSTVPVQGSVFQCMASTEISDGRRFVVTVHEPDADSEVDDLDFYCWMFSASYNALYMLPWAECDVATFDDVENTDLYRGTVMTFTTSTYRDGCQETTTPEPTTTDPPTTVPLTTEEASTWTFPVVLGSASYPCIYCYLYIGLCLLYLLVVFM